MTTIAYDGRSVAADSQAKCGNYRKPQEVQKLRRIGNVVFACTGAFCMFDPMIEWYQNGAKADKLPVNKDSDERTVLIVFDKGRCLVYTNLNPYPDECFAPDAWGSGYQYAIGAMKRDIMQNGEADAESAVRVACDCDTETGGKILVFDVNSINY